MTQWSSSEVHRKSLPGITFYLTLVCARQYRIRHSLSLNQPVQILVDVSAWSVLLQPHISYKLKGSAVQASQPIVDPVLVHTSRYHGLVCLSITLPRPATAQFCIISLCCGPAQTSLYPSWFSCTPVDTVVWFNPLYPSDPAVMCSDRCHCLVQPRLFPALFLRSPVKKNSLAGECPSSPARHFLSSSSCNS